MSKILLLIGAGGCIGSISRYLAGILCNRFFTSEFPYATFIVNISGCLILGIFYGLAERLNWQGHEWRMFLITGVCAGYTTFSSFTYENLKMLQQGQYLLSVAYSILSFSLGLFATWLGMILIKS